MPSAAVGAMAGALNVTVTFGTGLPYWSTTRTRSGSTNGRLICWFCGEEPGSTSSRAGAPTRFVRSKFSGAAFEGVETTTAYTPTTVPAVTVNCARPATSVVTVVTLGTAV